MYLLHFTEGQFPAFLDASKEARLLFFGLFGVSLLRSGCLFVFDLFIAHLYHPYDCQKMLLGFLVRSMGLAEWAVLLHFNTAGIILLVFSRNVISSLAFTAF